MKLGGARYLGLARIDFLALSFLRFTCRLGNSESVLYILASPEQGGGYIGLWCPKVSSSLSLSLSPARQRPSLPLVLSLSRDRH